MKLEEILARMGGLHSVAQELGVSDSQAESAAAALVPAIVGGFKKRAQTQPGGADGLVDLLGQLGGGELLDQVLAPQPTDVTQGNEVLGEIFGSRDVSRTVAQNAASESGLDAGLLRKMLPMLAMLVAGYMAKQQGTGDAPQPSLPEGGGLGDLLGGLLGGKSGRLRTPGSGGSGLAEMLDMNGDGNPLDDILRVIDKAMR